MGSQDQSYALVAPGWTGKLWALEQGVRAGSSIQTEGGPVEFLLFTDADISHPPESLRSLVSKALTDELDLVSVMARLQVSTSWERLLIPAFVYFFAKLYPFRWVNDPNKSIAAAAGGCVLLRHDALSSAGGLEVISGEIIDDCSLAGLIKKSRRPGGGRIWLGQAHNINSLRSNSSLKDIWGMVARTAYAQLRHSPLMLSVTVVGMCLVYLVPVGGAAGGLAAGRIDQESTLALWVLVLPLLDLGRLCVRRVRQGRRPWDGDRLHLAHELERRGLGVLAVLGVLLGMLVLGRLAGWGWVLGLFLGLVGWVRSRAPGPET